jgi:4-hydroxy-3-methylbut-2-enyl diphosphate reductase IspH
VVLIDHAGHPEVEGAMSQCNTADSDAIHLVEMEAEVVRPRCMTHSIRAA